MSHQYPDVSNHARRQFAMRSDDPSYPVISAWEEGVPLADDRGGHRRLGIRCEEARWHGPTGTVLLYDVHPPGIVTVYSDDDLTPPLMARVRELRAR